LFWFVLLIILIIIFIVFVVIAVVRAHKRKIEAGKEELIGKTAIVEAALTPKGTVFIEGERWTAVIDKGSAGPEEEVIITRIDGLKVFVTKKQ
jgi:membrane-bound ClpP family serine protease